MDKVALEILAIRDEAEKLKIKYGTESSIAKKLYARAIVLAEHYDKSKKQEQLNILFRANLGASQMIRSRRAGLSYEEQAKLIGWDAKKWKVLDSVDDTIREVKKMING